MATLWQETSRKVVHLRMAAVQIVWQIVVAAEDLV
jgi:hypothetical protein